jgi:hypothetical protein
MQTKINNNYNYLYLRHYHCVTGLKVQNQNLKFYVQIKVSNSYNFPYFLAVHTHQWYVSSLPKWTILLYFDYILCKFSHVSLVIFSYTSCFMYAIISHPLYRRFNNIPSIVLIY